MKFPFHEGVRCGALGFSGFVLIQRIAHRRDHRVLIGNRNQRVFVESRGIVDTTKKYEH